MNEGSESRIFTEFEASTLSVDFVRKRNLDTRHDRPIKDRANLKLKDPIISLENMSSSINQQITLLGKAR